MTVKIGLRLSGIDLRDIEAYERIPAELSELSFQTRGPVSLAVVYTDSPAPAATAADRARMITKLIDGVRVDRVHDELVSVSDIAARCEVAPEAARLWAHGKRRATLRPFPPPRDVVGLGAAGKTMSLYSWGEVVGWVREVLGIDPDEGIDYLTDRQRRRLDIELDDIADGIPRGGDGWRTLPVSGSFTAGTAPYGRVSFSTVPLLHRMDELLPDRAPARPVRGVTGR